jgi:hypothetical protein
MQRCEAGKSQPLVVSPGQAAAARSARTISTNEQSAPAHFFDFVGGESLGIC